MKHKKIADIKATCDGISQNKFNAKKKHQINKEVKSNLEIMTLDY
jgi:hypothetical protein